MHIFKKVHVYVLRQSIHVDSNSYKLTSIHINNIVLFDNIRKKTISKYNLHSAHNIVYQNGTSEPFMYCCPTLPSIYGVVATGLRLAINSAYYIWSLLYIYKEIYFDSYFFYKFWSYQCIVDPMHIHCCLSQTFDCVWLWFWLWSAEFRIDLAFCQIFIQMIFFQNNCHKYKKEEQFSK